MTDADVTIGPYETYLYLESAPGEEEAERLADNILGPKPGQDLFAMVAAMAAARRVASLKMLYSGCTPLHAAVGEVGWSRHEQYEDFATRCGPPFRSGEPATLHALRALAALGLTLAEDDPGTDQLRAALAWYKEARSTPAAASAPWTPAALAGNDTFLRHRLELLASEAGPQRDTLPVLTAAITLQRLAHPAVEPRTEMLLRGSGPADSVRAPGKPFSRLRGRPRRPRSHGITVSFDLGLGGTRAMLRAAAERGLPPGLIPDPERMPLFAADGSFQRSLGRAWQQAARGKINGMVLWTVMTSDGPQRYASGESLSAAFAVVFDEVRRLQRPLAGLTVIQRLVTGNAVIGKIDDLGYMQSVEGYDTKLDALGRTGKVIIPATDHQKAAAAARGLHADDLPQIVPVGRWKEAANKARRRSKKVLVRDALAGAALIATLTGTSLVIQANINADRDLSAANLQQLSSQSRALRDIDPAVSRLAAADAWQSAPSNQTRDLGIETAMNPLTGQFRAASGPVAVSPDGSLLAVSDPLELPIAGSGGSDVVLWSMTQQALIGYIPFPAGNPVYSVAFSPAEHDHLQTLAAAAGTAVVLYQVSASSPPRKVQTLPSGLPPGAIGGGATIAFSDDGMLAISPPMETGGSVWLFADTGGRYPSHPTRVLPQAGIVDSLSFGPDGSLAVGGDTGASVYPPGDDYATPPVAVAEKAVTGLGTDPSVLAQFNSAGLLAVMNARQTAIYRYSGGRLTGVPLLSQAGQATSWEGTTVPGLQPAALSSRDVLAVPQADGVHLYAADSMAAGFTDMATLPYPSQPEEVDVGFTPDGNSLIENLDGQVNIYDMQLLIGNTIVDEGGPGTLMAFDPAETAILAIFGFDGNIDLINVTDGRVTVLPGTAGASEFSFAPDGALAIVDTHFDLRLLPHPLTDPTRYRLVVRNGTALDVAFSPAGAMAVVTSLGMPTAVRTGPLGGTGISRTGRVTIYPPGNFSAGAVIAPRIPGADSGDPVGNPVFGPQGQLAVTAYRDGMVAAGVAVFAPGTYAQQGEIPVSEDKNPAIAFAPDGALAMGGYGEIQIYAHGDYANATLFGGTTSQESSITSQDTGEGLAFSRGGILISASQPTGVTFSDYQSSQTLATFTPGMPVGQIAVSPDGKYLAIDTSSDSLTEGNDPVPLWGATIVLSAPYLDGSASDGVRALCGQLGGPPGPDQWQQYFTSSLPYPQTCG